MIEYEELCAALERYVARTGGGMATTAGAPPTRPPQPSAPRQPLQMTTSPQRSQAPAYDPPTNEVALPPASHHDESHDPDFGALGGHHDDDATHVGQSPGQPPPLQPVDDHAEIDIGDVLSDDEL